LRVCLVGRRVQVVGCRVTVEPVGSRGRMRILHVLLSSGFAGSERSTAESCNAQFALRHEVVLVVRRGHRGVGGASVRDHLADGVGVEEVPDRLFTRRALRRIIQARAPDVIHTHLRRATRLVARIRPRTAVVATLHLSVNGPHYLKVDGLICNARWQMRDIPLGYKGLVLKADNSLVPHRRLSKEEIEALRRDLGVAPDEFLIGGVGRLAKSKGWDVLIRAFLAAELPRARCVILGEGRERARLERLARGRVALPGHRADVKGYYQAFDLFVCPSRREPLPRVILEALDAGVPVVASTAEGCRELLELYPGDPFEIGDVEALTGLLRRHYADRPPRRSVDLTRHHVQVAARAVVEWYAEVIERRRAMTDSARRVRPAGETERTAEARQTGISEHAADVMNAGISERTAQTSNAGDSERAGEAAQAGDVGRVGRGRT